jgi:hypothetical protein
MIAAVLNSPFQFAAAPAPPPGTSPSFVSASAISGSATIGVPAGIAEGDLLLAFVTNIAAANMSTPSGWTRQGAIFNWASYGYASALYYRVAGSSEPGSYSFGTSSSVGAMVAYRDASSIDVAGAYQDASGTTMTFSGITSSADSMLLAFVCDRDPGGVLTQPSGMTLRVEGAASVFRFGQAELLNANSADRSWVASSTTFNAAGILVSII